ncbi:MAG: hypothetical protein EB142_04670 [Actinobacteria bacterium]|nr:hypothetical protein [Actinomycetota bacterium]NDA37390.1 hypothetical protein [Acidimicrobiia bacterium]NDD00337.1 hypothetical protein [bacterium]NBQ45278.1 hypothetical protein [Actinomycetota bacterium]NDA96947.1 hypothetical protein [Actinomycetota bacterium]
MITKLTAALSVKLSTISRNQNRQIHVALATQFFLSAHIVVRRFTPNTRILSVRVVVGAIVAATSF